MLKRHCDKCGKDGAEEKRLYYDRTFNGNDYDDQCITKDLCPKCALALYAQALRKLVPNEMELGKLLLSIIDPEFKA